MRISVLATLTLVASAHAQPAAVLIEACNTINEAEKRLECLKAATEAAPKVSPVPKPHAELMDQVSAFQGVIESSISFNQYQQQLVTLTRAYSVYKTNNPTGQAVDPVGEALSIYVDAGRFWQASIRSGVRNRSMFVSSDVISREDLAIAGLGDLIGKYGLPLSSGDALGIMTGVRRSSGLATMWSRAKDLTSKAFAEPVPSKPAAVDEIKS